MDRRRFLTASGLAGLAGLAGCNQVTSTALGAVAPPAVPQDQLESGGWTLDEERTRTVFEQRYGPVTVLAKAHSLVYTDTELAKRVQKDTLGSVSGTLATFAATRVKFSPDLTQLPDAARGELIDQVESNSREQFLKRMQDAGLTNVQRAETGDFPIDTGETARYTGYTAEYEVGEFSFPLPNGEQMRVDVDPIAVTGDLAVWVHGDSVLVAGGAYPAENFATTLSRNVTDAVSVNVSVDLGLQPATYASEVKNLIAATQ